MTCWVAGVWCLFTALPDSVRARLRRPLLAACVAALLAVVSANAVVSATERPPQDPLEAAVMRLAVPAVATACAAGGPVLVRSEAHAGTPLGGDEVGLEVLALALEHRGVRVVVDSRLVDRFGVGRARPQPVREELLIVPASQPVPAGYRLVATADPLTPRQRADRDRISEELAPVLRSSSLRQIAERARRDPRFGARLRRLKKIPDVPQLALIVRPRAHS
jgi:hypothetical protein